MIPTIGILLVIIFWLIVFLADRILSVNCVVSTTSFVNSSRWQLSLALEDVYIYLLFSVAYYKTSSMQMVMFLIFCFCFLELSNDLS